MPNGDRNTTLKRQGQKLGEPGSRVNLAAARASILSRRLALTGRCQAIRTADDRPESQRGPTLRNQEGPGNATNVQGCDSAQAAAATREEHRRAQREQWRASAWRGDGCPDARMGRPRSQQTTGEMTSRHSSSRCQQSQEPGAREGLRPWIGMERGRSLPVSPAWAQASAAPAASTIRTGQQACQRTGPGPYLPPGEHSTAGRQERSGRQQRPGGEAPQKQGG